jgi:hypothetical protein
MSQRIEPPPVLRIVSCITGRSELLPVVEAELLRAFGPVALKSSPFPFELTDYYQGEMGRGLRRHWLCFQRLFGADELSRSRVVTGRIEEALVEEGNRRVNLDPGYLDLGKLVLASWKAAPDKVYLGQGAWAHTCLRYRSGVFSAPDHSFPDFRDGRFNGFMLQAREVYKRLLREVGREPPPLGKAERKETQ